MCLYYINISKKIKPGFGKPGGKHRLTDCVGATVALRAPFLINKRAFVALRAVIAAKQYGFFSI